MVENRTLSIFYWDVAKSQCQLSAIFSTMSNSSCQEFGEQTEEFGIRLREFRGPCHRQGPTDGEIGWNTPGFCSHVGVNYSKPKLPMEKDKVL